MNAKSILQDSEVRLDKRTGIPKKVRGEFALPLADTDEDSIKAFLMSNADELQLAMEEKDLTLIKDVTTPTGRVLRFQQNKDGIPILGTEILVRLDRQRRVKQLNLEHVSRIRIATPVADEGKGTAAKAKKAAVDAIGEHKLRQAIAKPQEIYYSTPQGLRLCYLVSILTEGPFHDWRILVDAYTGEVLVKDDLMVSVDGSGHVFDPNPVVTSGNNTWREPDATDPPCPYTGNARATIDAELTIRTLRDITFAGGTYKLDGPYVKLVNVDSPNVAPPEEASADGFEYATSGHGHFEDVMVYYHIDTIQRYLQNLGITNAHSHQIEADAHAGNSYAYFSTPPTGDGRVRFGLSGNSMPEECRPDRGQDGHVMLHEYGHAILHDQVPGWGDPTTSANPGTGWRETRAMGEGFGDILACVYFAPNHPFQREVFEDWIFVDVGGLRRVDGTKVYPTDWDPGTPHNYGCHANGEIWSAALWNIYRTIGGDSINLTDREAARDELLKTLLLSNFDVAANGSMPDGAEAFMEENAELEEFRLQHGIEILDSFHDRGLLECEVGSDLKIDALWSQQSESPAVGWERVEAGQSNWFYATVRNASATTTARAFVIAFSFKSPFATPVYSTDFRDNIISAAVGFDLSPGASTTVKARWPEDMIPPIPAGATVRHGCILAEVYNPEDQVAAGVTNIWSSNGKLKQRNTDIVDVIAGDTLDYFIDISNYNLMRPELARLEIIREPRWQHVDISLHHPNKRFFQEVIRRVEYVKPAVVRPAELVASMPEFRILESTRVEIGMGAGRRPLVMNLAPGSSMPLPVEEVGDEALEDALIAPADPEFMRMDAYWVPAERGAHLAIRTGLRVGLPVIMKPRDRTQLNFKLKVPKDARPGDSFSVVVKQRNKKGELLGEFDIKVNVVAEH